jgi:anti-sigma B factor antagonist
MTISHQDNLLIIKTDSSVDIVNSETLRQEVIKAIEQGAQNLLIDCQDLSFLDSSGLSVMVMALKRAREANIRMALCAVGEQAMLLFQLTGMTKVFEIFEDRAAFEKEIAVSGC